MLVAHVFYCWVRYDIKHQKQLLAQSQIINTIEIKTVQNTSANGYQYVVKTTQNENALLQTNLENKFTVGERLLAHGAYPLN